jgi:hypothetical protein
MAKKSYQSIGLVVPGITNYDKLRNLNKKSTKIHQFNPFMTQMSSEQIMKNHEAESLDAKFLDEEIYNQLLMMNGLNQHRTGRKSSYYGLPKKARRQQLTRMSIHDVVEEVLTKLTDEVVVNTQGKDPISLHIDTTVWDRLKLDKKFQDEVKDFAIEEFKRIIKMYGFHQHGSETSLWNKAYLFFIEGSQAYELVWDNLENPTKIIGIHEIDALEIEPFWFKGVKYWKHHRKLAHKEDYVILYDSQVMIINWADASPNNRMSYLEHLFKSFNTLRIMDEAMVNWTITNSTFRMLFKIPTGGKSRIAASQSIAKAKHQFNDDIHYNSETGEVNINGGANQMAMKSYWMGDGDSGSPEIEAVQNQGPDLGNTERNEYFAKKFYRNAKMPFSRFDANASETWNIDTRSQLREEISFNRFVSRIQDILKMLILKPLYLQLAARFPELKDDSDVLDAISVRFTTYSVFEELMHLDIMQEKIEAIERMSEAFTIDTPEGDRMKYFSIEFLVNEYLPELTKEKLDLNAKMVAQEIERGFKHQMKIYKLRAKYDPDRNFDETGTAVDPELIDIIDKGLDSESDIDAEVEDQESVKAEVEQETGVEVETGDEEAEHSEEEKSKKSKDKDSESKEIKTNDWDELRNKINS